MAVKAIAHSYWRRVRDGARAFGSLPASVREDVRAGSLSPERFAQLTGEIYEETEAV